MNPVIHPPWLTSVAVISLVIAAVCFVAIVVDILLGHKQHVWIMNLVWPITALYAGPIAIYFYFKVGKLSTHDAMVEAKKIGKETPGKQKPFWQMTMLAATHCGSGCALGDLDVNSARRSSHCAKN